MRQIGPVSLALLLAFSSTFASAQTPAPEQDGVVTRATSYADFDVNGLHVVLERFATVQKGLAQSGNFTHSDAPYIGESVSVTGYPNRGKKTLHASDVVFHPTFKHTVSGSAMIDRVLSSATATEIEVRADGYPIWIRSTTKTKFNDPITSLSNVSTNVWIDYHGTLEDDGTVVADSAAFWPNVLTDREQKLLAKTDYDPAAVSKDSHQNFWSKQLLGLDPQQIPPYHDAEMQARVDRIGNSLIPAYQRNLPATDERKIVFAFQLIDGPKWHDALTMPAGVILVPRQIVEKLKDDSELATVLADNIACALNKQSYITAPKLTAVSAGTIAGTAAGFFVPGLGLATAIASTSSQVTIARNLRQQSGRVSLDLMHEAGYDIQHAPMAWWRLEAKHPDDPTASNPPDRALYLYSTLGELWTNHTRAVPPVDKAASSPPPAPNLLK